MNSQIPDIQFLFACSAYKYLDFSKLFVVFMLGQAMFFD